MKHYLLSGLLFLLTPLGLDAQVVKSGTRSVYGYADLYRTNQPGTVQQFQLGMEVGYQVNSRISFNGGFDFWSGQSTPWLVLGNRFTPFDKAFIRYRALIGREAEVALGLGYQQPISERWLLSLMTDYYLSQHQLGLRFGIGYRWRDREALDPAGS
jgi:hypothetical protein